MDVGFILNSTHKKPTPLWFKNSLPVPKLRQFFQFLDRRLKNGDWG